MTYFGKLTELTGRSSEELEVNDVSLNGIRSALERAYPAMKTMSYQIAENNRILTTEDNIQSQQLDVFPPFSGG